MPELPEVETMARDLRRRLVGRTIVEAWVAWPNLIRTSSVDDFVDALAGRRVRKVGRRAKWLLITLDGDLALTIQPRMTGVLSIVTGDTPIGRHEHLGLQFDDGNELRLHDVRKFSRIGLYHTGRSGLRDDAGRDPFAGLGPEPLDPAFSYEQFKERLAVRRGKLKPLLLDQGFIVGVGNIYADESLWIARLHPERGVESLSGADRRRLYGAVVAVLDEAVRNRGSSVSDYHPPAGRARMQDRLRVYHRTGQPCQRCRTPIARISVGGRGTHLCPKCQRAPSV